ncbi:hypothetical protein KA005_04930, partial [bacterium]|nr:hypothetical protein [bacterium]
MPIFNEMSMKAYEREQKRLKRERWEIEFAQQLDAEGYSLGEDPENLLPGEYAREYKFHPVRKWRFDFALKDRVAVEIEGGIWAQGRHTRGSGFIKDAEKYNTAAAMGWRVFRFPSDMVEDGSAIKF